MYSNRLSMLATFRQDTTLWWQLNNRNIKPQGKDYLSRNGWKSIKPRELATIFSKWNVAGIDYQPAFGWYMQNAVFRYLGWHASCTARKNRVTVRYTSGLKVWSIEHDIARGHFDMPWCSSEKKLGSFSPFNITICKRRKHLIKQSFYHIQKGQRKSAVLNERKVRRQHTTNSDPFLNNCIESKE